MEMTHHDACTEHSRSEGTASVRPEPGGLRGIPIPTAITLTPTLRWPPASMCFRCSSGASLARRGGPSRVFDGVGQATPIYPSRRRPPNPTGYPLGGRRREHKRLPPTRRHRGGWAARLRLAASGRLYFHAARPPRP